MPKISIITPVYCDTSHKVDWLDEMIESVQSQTLADWEIILINDKSPLPLDPVKMKHANDNRLRWIENAENFGPAKTRNTAVALAESECILPLDSDDLLATNEVLEVMYDTWIMDTTKVIYGNLQMYKQVASNVFQRGKIIQLGEYTFELAMNLQGIMPVTVMHSKDCHYDSGGWKDEMSAGLEDLEYWIAAGKKGYCGQKINYTTLVYRKQDFSRSRRMFTDNNFEVMQQKIKFLHEDIYKGRFPVGCCGKSASVTPASDPAVMSQQSQMSGKVTLELPGVDEREWVWKQYTGQKKGNFARISKITQIQYMIQGSGHIFPIHKKDDKSGIFNTVRDKFITVPDPREHVKPEPMQTPVIEEPQIIPVPKPELSTIIQLDNVAAQTREVEIVEAIIEPNPPDSYTAVMGQPTEPKYRYHLLDLNLSEGLTNKLDNADYTIEKLAKTTPQELSSIPGIGVKRANDIITKAKELIDRT